MYHHGDIIYIITVNNKSFAAYEISFKRRENFHGFCFICMESAKQSHCLTKHFPDKLRNSMKTTKLFSCSTFHYTVYITIVTI